MVILMIPVIWLYLMVVFRVQFRQVGAHLNRSIYQRELKNLGPLSHDQRVLFVVFLAIIILWLTDRWHDVHTVIVVLGGVLILFLVETLKKEDLNRINWNALLTFGGGLALGNVLILTGVSDWIALRLFHRFCAFVGTPPTMMAYSTGYFQVQDIFKRGIVLDLIGIVLLSFGAIWIWRLLGMVTFKSRSARR